MISPATPFQSPIGDYAQGSSWLNMMSPISDILDLFPHPPGYIPELSLENSPMISDSTPGSPTDVEFLDFIDQLQLHLGSGDNILNNAISSSVSRSSSMILDQENPAVLPPAMTRADSQTLPATPSSRPSKHAAARRGSRSTGNPKQRKYSVVYLGDESYNDFVRHLQTKAGRARSSSYMEGMGMSLDISAFCNFGPFSAPPTTSSYPISPSSAGLESRDEESSYFWLRQPGAQDDSSCGTSVSSSRRDSVFGSCPTTPTPSPGKRERPEKVTVSAKRNGTRTKKGSSGIEKGKARSGSSGTDSSEDREVRRMFRQTRNARKSRSAGIVMGDDTGVAI